MKGRIAQLLLATGWFVVTAHAQTRVSIGVFGLFHPHELELRAVAGRVLSARGETERFVLNGEPSRRRLVIRAAGDQVVVSGLVLRRLSVSARDGSAERFQIAVPGRIHRIYLGILTITAEHGELVPVVILNQEDAVASIVASEMPPDAPIEALKAQAVVTRSFLAAGRRHRNFDFCDTTHCQFFRSPDDANEKVRKAVEATSGLVLRWNQRPIAAMYSSRCGGQTNTLRETGMEPGEEYPYFSVPCAWCREHPVHWRTSLAPGNRPSGQVNESSRIRYARQWGWGALPGNRYNVSSNETGEWIDGHSIGHGIGLCQWGAIGMAQEGRGFSAILEHYYPNAEIRPLP